ncbi:PAS domain-containing protein [Acidisoma sp. S159]|uniref:PAS domain-containing protein n=1 Tax=Acidisoma sp. S159 TaxID=1747225 RepID=UPI00352B3568
MSVSPLSMVLTDPHQPDYPLIFVNRAFTALTGFSEKEVLGRNCRFLQGPETDRTAVRVLGDAVAVVGEAQVDLWNYRKNGSQFWNSMSGPNSCCGHVSEVTGVNSRRGFKGLRGTLASPTDTERIVATTIAARFGMPTRLRTGGKREGSLWLC